MTGRPLLYVDTNIVIRLVESRDADILRIIRRLKDRGGFLCTSELTLAEVLVVPVRDGKMALIADYEELLSTGDGVLMLPVSRTIIRKAAELRASLNLRLPDAIHVASAVLYDCRFILSSDKRLRMPDSLTRIDVGDWQELDNLS